MRIFGFILYSFLKSIRTRFIFYSTLDKYVSNARCFALRLQGAKIGKGTIIRENVFIAFPYNLIVGNNSKIGSYAQIYNYSIVTIGHNCELGPNLYIQTNEHVFDQRFLLIRDQGSTSKEIYIGNNVYSGYGVTILSKGCVSDDTVLGACTLVNKKLEPGFIYAGVPSKKIKSLYE
jgi:acetyltransferase-like isoleucine patch superfamily enzyme